MKIYIRSMLEIIGIMALVVVLWQLIEKILVGEVTPSIVDSIVGTVLSYSLYFNYKHWIGE